MEPGTGLGFSLPIGVGLAAIGSGIGLGFAVNGACLAIGRQPQAAGKIHTDMYNKFVCAEVVAFDELMSAGGMREARENGLARTEGKEYIVRDGDVILIKFGK